MMGFFNYLRPYTFKTQPTTFEQRVQKELRRREALNAGRSRHTDRLCTNVKKVRRELRRTTRALQRID